MGNRIIATDKDNDERVGILLLTTEQVCNRKACIKHYSNVTYLLQNRPQILLKKKLKKSPKCDVRHNVLFLKLAQVRQNECQSIAI